jgi:tRNA nucleotidyltransferase (CCA-adding enzyme)
MAVTEYHLHSHKAKELKPATILKLFQNIGALRDDRRLSDFLYCCEADARGRTGFEDITYHARDYLMAALSAVKKVDISDLVADGVTGAEIGRQLIQRQIEQLTTFKSNY